MNRILTVAFLAVLSASPSFAQNTLWEENPAEPLTELSNSHSNPTFVGSLSLGESLVSGAVLIADGDDRDVFTFRVDANHVLDSIKVRVDGERHFLGISRGTSISPTNSSSMLLSRLISDGEENVNVLTVAPPEEFSWDRLRETAPLGPGDYTLWIQETAFENFGYDITFQTSLTAVPEPGSCFVLGLLAVGTCVRRRRR